MLDFLRDAVGQRLPLDDYVADYDRRFLTAGSHKSWKFEREQNFRQPGTPSWDAFARGDWDDALQLIARQRDDLRKLADEDAARGVTTLRVRVVEEPIVPYVQWELHSLRLRAACGVRRENPCHRSGRDRETGGRRPTPRTPHRRHGHRL